MEARYSRNAESLTPAETEALHGKKVCVAGCGGLGGYIIETLARLGVLYITAVDCDVFEESNLNRQLFCTEKTVGRPKAEAAKLRIAEVNSGVHVNAVNARLGAENAEGILRGHDIVMDALDSAPSRFVLAETCAGLGIPMIHGGIGGWYGHVSAIRPGGGALGTLYAGASGRGEETRLGNLPFTAAAVAAAQCAEAVKVLLGKGGALYDAVLQIDLLHNSFDIIELNDVGSAGRERPPSSDDTPIQF